MTQTHTHTTPLGCGTLLLAAVIYIALFVSNVFAMGFLQPYTHIPEVTEGMELMTVVFYPIPFFILHAFYTTSRFISMRLRDGEIPFSLLLKEAGLGAALGLFFGVLLLLRLSVGAEITVAAGIVYPVLFGVTGGLGALVLGRFLNRISEESAHRDTGRKLRFAGSAHWRFVAIATALFSLVVVAYPATFNAIFAHYLEARRDIPPDASAPLLTLRDALFAIPGVLVVGQVVVSMLQLRPPPQVSENRELAQLLIRDFLRGVVLGVTIEGGYWLSLVIFEPSVDPIGFVLFRTLIFALYAGLITAALSAVSLARSARSSTA